MKKLVAMSVALLISFVTAAVPALAFEGAFGADEEAAPEAYAISAPVEPEVPEAELSLSAQAAESVDAEGAAPADAASAEASPAEPAAEEPLPQEIPPTVLSIKKSATKTVYLGTKYRIRVPGKKVKSYKSSAKRIAAVNGKGIVTPKKVGTAKITVALSGKKLTLTLKVADPAVPAKVTIEGVQAVAAAGDSFRLTAGVSPATASQAVKWTSSKKTVAIVDADGLVNALKPGRTTIIAATPNKKKANFTLTVKKRIIEPYMISHAMGGIDDSAYSNSLEAFEENYAEGHRCFEVDIEITSDGRLVLWHDWKRRISKAFKANYRPTFDEFMGAKLYDKYTPLSIEDLLLIMDAHPDITVITDTKYADSATVKKQFKAIVGAARELGVDDALDRLVVEIYTREMYGVVESVHHFNAYVFTLYKLFKSTPGKTQLKSIAKFCADRDIDIVAMYAKWWKPEYMNVLADCGVEAALYTTNDPAQAKKFFGQGVVALCTDFLPPA